MAKRVAAVAVNPVNGFGLFQYLEAFFENGIGYEVYAVAPAKEIKTNCTNNQEPTSMSESYIKVTFAGF